MPFNFIYCGKSSKIGILHVFCRNIVKLDFRRPNRPYGLSMPDAYQPFITLVNSMFRLICHVNTLSENKAAFQPLPLGLFCHHQCCCSYWGHLKSHVGSVQTCCLLTVRDPTVPLRRSHIHHLFQPRTFVFSDLQCLPSKGSVYQSVTLAYLTAADMEFLKNLKELFMVRW